MSEEWPEVDVPGSRPRVEHAKPEPPPTPEKQWDDNPQVFRVNGVEVELFRLSALAMALGRKPNTIRVWENKDWFPRTDLRAPRKGAGSQLRRRLDGRGGVVVGDRLYPKAFIAGCIVIAEEEGVMENNFSERVFDLWEQVRL